MTKNDIREARISLKSIPVFNEIINKKDGFYYYYNWMAGKENKLHYCECGHCAFGSGKHEDINEGKNGVWIGPFETRDMAKVSLKTHFNMENVEECGHCLMISQRIGSGVVIVSLQVIDFIPNNI